MPPADQPDADVPAPDPASMRRSYERTGIDVDDLGPDPLAAFGRWFVAADAGGVVEPNAMVLATVDGDGCPAARTVLLKGYDERGLMFFTNLTSAKAADLAGHPFAALVFPWHAISRQVRVTGAVTEIGRAEVEAYFSGRPRESQLGAWASPQSTVVSSRADLDLALRAVTERFPPDSGPVPAPPGWGGYRVVPQTWEFWAGRVGRLHDRLRFRRGDSGGAGGAPSSAPGSAAGGVSWEVERLAP